MEHSGTQVDIAPIVVNYSDVNFRNISCDRITEPHRYLASLHINGAMTHVAAVEVVIDDDDGQVARCECCEHIVDGAFMIDPDDPFQTIDLLDDGRDFIIVATPGK